MFTASSRSAKPPPVVLRELSGVQEPETASHKARRAAMATFTAGPAMAIQNSCAGLSGILSSRATPPMGSSVMSHVPTPKRRAASA